MCVNFNWFLFCLFYFDRNRSNRTDEIANNNKFCFFLCFQFVNFFFKLWTDNHNKSFFVQEKSSDDLFGQIINSKEKNETKFLKRKPKQTTTTTIDRWDQENLNFTFSNHLYWWSGKLSRASSSSSSSSVSYFEDLFVYLW